jgi:predicted nucleic acid-binding protein
MICIDSSVVAKLFLREEHTDRARALYFTTIRAGTPIIAPSLLLSELTNIVCQQMRGSRALPRDEAEQLLASFLALPIAIYAPAGMHELALAIAAAYGLAASYDAHYLALAQQLDCEFWTNDIRLQRRVGNDLSFVRWIGDFDIP